MFTRNDLLENLTSALPEEISTGYRAITTQSYTEANSKNGRQHEISIYREDVAGSGTINTIFSTGDCPVILKKRLIGYTGDGVCLDIFEDATYTGGTLVLSYNSSRIYQETCNSAFYSDATITDEGTQVFPTEYVIGNESRQGKGGTNDIFGRERILKPNTVYLFKLVSLDTGTQNIFGFDAWYEGEIDLPLEDE